MKKILLQILHYLWIRRKNIYSLYVKYKKNGDIKDLTFKDFEDFTNIEGGAVLDENSISEKDYLLGNIKNKNLDDYLKNLKPDTVGIYYNQGALTRTRNACTLFGSFGAVSDLTGYKFSEKEILEICDIAEKDYGWQENYGGWIYKAVDCVRNYWNDNNPNKKIVSFRINLKTDKDLIKKLSGKTLIIGYRTTREHYVDSQDNGNLDKTCFTSCGAKVTGGHCIRYNNNLNIDNYKGRKKFNEYNNSYLELLSKEGTYFTYAYVYFYKEDFKDIFEKSDYEKYLDRGFIEHPDPNRILTEKLYGTIREREIRTLESKK